MVVAVAAAAVVAEAEAAASNSSVFCRRCDALSLSGCSVGGSCSLSAVF